MSRIHKLDRRHQDQPSPRLQVRSWWSRAELDIVKEVATTVEVHLSYGVCRKAAGIDVSAALWGILCSGSGMV